jgi:hypothetical protein
MKKIIFLAISASTLSLMSFVNSKGLGIIEFDGNIITLKDTEKVTPEELSFLSNNVIGWTICDKIADTSHCRVKDEGFPHGATAAVQNRLNAIIKKYQ